MKKHISAITAGAALLAIGFSGNAISDEAMAAAKGCMACHQISASSAPALGPVYADIAAKYKGDAAAEDMLVNKVIAGGDGNWDTVVPLMPPNAVTEEEARTLVKWLLTL